MSTTHQAEKPLPTPPKPVPANKSASKSASTVFLVVFFLVAALLPTYILPLLRAHSSSSSSHAVSSTANSASMAPVWLQKTLQLPAKSKGCYLITSDITGQLGNELKGIKIGLLNLFIQHTSAALTLNENWDSDVRKDMSDALDRVVPEEQGFRHDAEGSDDMPVCCLRRYS
jgi:hypothetical protein